MMLRGMGALPANYQDCFDLMCRAFRTGYVPTNEENLACSQLRGTFEGKSFSPLDCPGTSAALPPPPSPSAPVVAAPPVVSNKFSQPGEYVAGDLSFGWRIRNECYPQADQTPVFACPSATWFYALVAAAAVAGLATRKGRS